MTEVVFLLVLPLAAVGLSELVLLGLVGGLGWWLVTRLRAAPPTASEVQSAVHDSIPELRGEIDRLRDGMRMLASEVGQLRAMIGEMQVPALPEPELAPALPAADGFVLPPIEADEPAALASPAPAVSEAFVRWCRERGPLASKRELFGQFLRLALPSASVETVYRDPSGSAQSVQFVRQAGPASAEYWLVDASNHYLLVPVPQGPSQFRNLAPAFEGAAIPAALATFSPAELETDGDAFTLTQPGQVG